MSTDEFFEAIASGDADRVATAVATDSSLLAACHSTGATPMRFAVYNFHRELIPILRTPSIDFWTACTIGDLDAILANPPSDLDVLSPDGFAPVALAAAFGANDVVKYLLDEGADSDQRSTALGGVTAIHAAIFGRNELAVRLLMDAGADIDAKQASGYTALHGAAANGMLQTVIALRESGADVEATTDDGKRPIDLAQSDEIRKALA